MGTNTLTTASDGTIIPASDKNSLVTALKDNFVPRDTTTLAPTDLAGDLGSTSYRWKVGYLQKAILGAISSNLSIEEDGSNRLIIKVGGSTALTIDSGGLIPDSIVTDMLQDNSVTNPKRAALGQQISSSSSNFSTTSTSFVDVTNLSVTLTTTGRPVFLGLISDGSTNGSGVWPFSGTTDDVGGTLSFLRDSTNLGHMMVGTDTNTQSAWAWRLTPSIFHIDTPTSGTYTYKVQGKVDGSNDDLYVQYMKLIAFEL